MYPEFSKTSKNKTFFTKHPTIARAYKYALGDSEAAKKHGLTTIKSVVPHSHYISKRTVRDDTYSKSSTKSIALSTEKKIGTRFIKGSDSYKGIKQFATKRNMKRYLSTSSGKKRFAVGLANAAVATGGAAYAGSKIHDVIKRKLKGEDK